MEEEQEHSMVLGMALGKVVVGQGQLLGEEQALGRGMVVVVAHIPIRVAGFGQWQEEELPEGQKQSLEPEHPGGGCGGGEPR